MNKFDKVYESFTSSPTKPLGELEDDQLEQLDQLLDHIKSHLPKPESKEQLAAIFNVLINDLKEMKSIYLDGYRGNNWD